VILVTDRKKNRLHPNHAELYTPIGPQFYELLDQIYREYEGNWRIVAWKTALRLKQLQRFRTGETKAISLRVLDRIITTSGVGNLQDFVFFTAEDLVKLGIWKEPYYVEGNKRIQGKVVTEAPVMSRLERERLGRKKRRDRIARAKKEEKRRDATPDLLSEKNKRRGLWR